MSKLTKKSQRLSSAKSYHDCRHIITFNLAIKPGAVLNLDVQSHAEGGLTLPDQIFCSMLTREHKIPYELSFFTALII